MSLQNSLSIHRVVLIPLIASLLHAPNVDSEEAHDSSEMHTCIERALPDLSLYQHLTVTVTGESGHERETQRTLRWKRFNDGFSKALIRITKPVNEAGLAVLLKERAGIEPTIYMYTPELQRSRRVGGGAITASIMGTDLSYEDFTHFMKIIKSAQYEHTRDDQIDGYAVYVLETTPTDARSAYSSIRTFMDKALCLPIKTEFFGPSGSLDKELVIDRDQVQEIGGRNIPFLTVMRNHKNGTSSQFLVTDANVDPDLRDSFFTRTELKRGAREN